MFEILSKEALNPTVVRIAVSAPRIARKAEPGQFVILRAKEQSERIPLTVADYDPRGGYRHRDLPDRGCRHHGA